jgi:hypothetical protein
LDDGSKGRWPEVLSMMNIDTKELYVSDDVSRLYKGGGEILKDIK